MWTPYVFINWLQIRILSLVSFILFFSSQKYLKETKKYDRLLLRIVSFAAIVQWQWEITKGISKRQKKTKKKETMSEKTKQKQRQKLPHKHKKKEKRRRKKKSFFFLVEERRRRRRIINRQKCSHHQPMKYAIKKTERQRETKGWPK